MNSALSHFSRNLTRAIALRVGNVPLRVQHCEWSVDCRLVRAILVGEDSVHKTIEVELTRVESLEATPSWIDDLYRRLEEEVIIVALSYIEQEDEDDEL